MNNTTIQEAMEAVYMRKLEIDNPSEYLKIRNEKFLREAPAKYHWLVTGINPANV